MKKAVEQQAQADTRAGQYLMNLSYTQQVNWCMSHLLDLLTRSPLTSFYALNSTLKTLQTLMNTCGMINNLYGGTKEVYRVYQEEIVPKLKEIGQGPQLSRP